MKKLIAFLLIVLLPSFAWPVDLTWIDNSGNEDGFVVERKVDGGEYAEIGRVGENVTKLSDNDFPAGKLTYRVKAFNADGISDPSNEAAITYFADYPVVLTGSAPEQAFIIVSLTQEQIGSSTKLVLEARDPDFPDEGELWINGNGPIALFPGGNSAHDAQVVTITVDVPIEWWVVGDNNLRFVHTKTAGYRILSANLVSVMPLVPPGDLAVR